MPKDEPDEPDQIATSSHATASGESQDTQVEVELDLEDYVLQWFQAQGDDYERLMNRVLRDYIAAEQASTVQADPIDCE